MEDFPILLIMLIVYLIAGASGKKKKPKQGRQRRAQDERTDTRQTARSRQAQRGFAAAFDRQMTQRAPAEAKTQPGPQTDCHRQTRMHLHDVSQTQMHAAQEGEDPCHAGGAAMDGEEKSPIFAPQTDEQRQALAQDMLRGVIMSEILTRPCARRATYGNRRNG